MFSTLKKWFIGRPLKSGAEGEGGLLGKCRPWPCSLVTRFLLLPMVQSKLSLVLMTVSAGAIWWSIPIGIVVLVLLASLTISYPSGHSCLPTRGRSLHGDYGELVSQSCLIAGGSLLVGLHADGSGICFFRCRCHHVSDSVSSSL